jgi:hypothetical protein
MNDTEIMDLKETAKFLRIAESTLRDRISGRRRPSVPHFRIGAKILFRRSALFAWLEELERQHSGRGAA